MRRVFARFSLAIAVQMKGLAMESGVGLLARLHHQVLQDGFRRTVSRLPAAALPTAVGAVKVVTGTGTGAPMTPCRMSSAMMLCTDQIEPASAMLARRGASLRGADQDNAQRGLVEGGRAILDQVADRLHRLVGERVRGVRLAEQQVLGGRVKYERHGATFGRRVR